MYLFICIFADKPKKNWDKIATEEIGQDKLEGDEGLNKVFQDIYSNASEEQRRAMIKSFVCFFLFFIIFYNFYYLIFVQFI